MAKPVLMGIMRCYVTVGCICMPSKKSNKAQACSSLECTSVHRAGKGLPEITNNCILYQPSIAPIASEPHVPHNLSDISPNDNVYR